MEAKVKFASICRVSCPSLDERFGAIVEIHLEALVIDGIKMKAPLSFLYLFSFKDSSLIRCGIKS